MQYEKVLAGLAGTTRACAYDRAGMGYREPAPLPRTLDRLSANLEALLRQARLPRPYVLAGASAGGIVARHLASRRGTDICGLVLIDSPHEDFASAMPRSRARASRQAHIAVWLARFGLMRLFDPFHVGDSPGARAIAYRPQAFEAAASLTMGSRPRSGSSAICRPSRRIFRWSCLHTSDPETCSASTPTRNARPSRSGRNWSAPSPRSRTAANSSWRSDPAI